MLLLMLLVLPGRGPRGERPRLAPLLSAPSVVPERSTIPCVRPSVSMLDRCC
jgi:hypothetical protein